MAFRALLFCKNADTNTALVAACEVAGIRAEVCSDIFTAIDKGKTRTFSCIITDWAEQPEASFLLKRARESEPNRETISLAIVDHEPTAAELRDSRLDFLLYRPFTAPEANAVLTEACEKMQPMAAEDARESFDAAHTAKTASPEVPPVADDVPEFNTHHEPPAFTEDTIAEGQEEYAPIAADQIEEEASPQRRKGAGWRAAFAAAILLTAAFSVWNAREVIRYLSQTREGRIQVMRDSVEAFFSPKKTEVAPVAPVNNDAQIDALLNGDSHASEPTPSLGIVATQSTVPESRIPLPRAADFPLPQPEVERHEIVPVHRARVVIPDSMKNSATIERPVVVAVNPALMPVSTPPPSPSPSAPEQVNEPVAVSEQAARALLIHSVDPSYPPEASAQKLHGPVVLQALIGRDGSVQDLKIVRGYFVLGKAAIAAVKQWKFQPYTLNGHAAATQTVITVNFN
jgi:TonB family protein